MDPVQRIAMVTGANRGIGLEVCRQLAQLGHRVLLTSRDEAKGRQAAQKLEAVGLPVVFHQLDVTDEASITAISQFVVKEFHRLDLLVNNAGIYLRGEDKGVLSLSLNALRQTLETNTLGALRLCQVFIPLMRRNGYGRVVNVSSTMGQHARMQHLNAAYRLSKDALNALTQMLANAVRGEDILVNACSPGWVRTDMGGRSAPRSVEQGADTIVWLATLPSGGPSGKFFEDQKELDW